MKNPFRFGTAVLAVGYWLSAISAQAHPGHGPDEVQPAHYLVSPDHLGWALVAAVIVFCVFRALGGRHDANTP